MKKKHFYEGMKPSPSDFDVLQQNTEDAVNATTRAITGAGVLTGLEVSMSGNTVTVTRGKAICNNGQMVELLADTTVPYVRGLVVLRRSVTDLSTAVDIRQNTVWEERGDTTTLHFVSSAGSGEELVILGGVSGSGYYETHRQIASGWDTVAALRQQMKQELTTKIEQVKTELATKIEQMKTDLTSAAAQARSDTTYAISVAQDAAINTALPIGFIYVQFPAQKTPTQLSWPGTWQNISATYLGCFFRAEGGLAETFRGLTSWGLLQQDAGRNITGSIRRDHTYAGYSNGAFYYGGAHHNSYTWSSSDRDARNQDTIARFDASRSWGSAHTAKEFRPRNYTIRIWKRTS